jgi:hypothetical protein
MPVELKEALARIKDESLKETIEAVIAKAKRAASAQKTVCKFFDDDEAEGQTSVYVKRASLKTFQHPKSIRQLHTSWPAFPGRSQSFENTPKKKEAELNLVVTWAAYRVLQRRFDCRGRIDSKIQCTCSFPWFPSLLQGYCNCITTVLLLLGEID